ncbi:MAG: DUF5996 family protein [Longimicrobiales bacterium]
MGRLLDAVKTRVHGSDAAFADQDKPEVWPDFSYSASLATLETLHRWTQIVGKTRLALAPPLNHWWQVALYISARGLSTSAMPYGERTVEIEFDFVDQRLQIRTSDGEVAAIELEERSVADFYHAYTDALQSLEIHTHIWPVPVEIADRTAFPADDRHRRYDGALARTYWEILAQTEHVLEQFRGRYLGKASPVHFFWGSFDLAHTRFSGRRAPPHPGGIPNTPDFITREAYSHECFSCGFWNGNEAVPYPAFYAYSYPAPAGFDKARIQPATAFFNTDLREFILPYEAVRAATRPAETLLTFAQQTYEAAARLGEWNRVELERA